MKYRHLILAGAALLAALALPNVPAKAAATLQTAHVWLCSPDPAAGAVGPRRVVNTASTASPQPSYNLNNQGCGLFASADVGFFVSQGYSQGANLFNLIQTGITATTTTTSSTITLPAYGYIVGIVLSETAGNAITGGVDIGDSGTAAKYVSAIALGANATITVTDALTLARVNVPSGVPTADQILVACHTACNSGSINITILYGYFWL
jgi:hypothetical protein